MPAPCHQGASGSRFCPKGTGYRNPEQPAGSDGAGYPMQGLETDRHDGLTMAHITTPGIGLAGVLAVSGVALPIDGGLMTKRLPTNMIYSMQARAVVDDQWLQAEAAREGNRWHLRLRDVPGQRVIMTRTLPAMTSTQAMQTMLDWLMGGGETENDDG